MKTKAENADIHPLDDNRVPSKAPNSTTQSLKEIGGQKGPEPTRFGDWEKNGRCSDF
jgi:hypothetical protein